MKSHLFRTLSAVLIALLTLTAPAFAQTATTSTTLSSAITSTSTTTLVVASATNVDAGGLLYIDTEAFDVVSVSGTTVRVARGAEGTRVSLHPASSAVYVAAKAQKTGVFKGGQSAFGTCTRANESFLPQIDLVAQRVWDCPVGVTVWVPINEVLTARSQAFNLDNGAGTTIDALLIRHPRPIVIATCRIVYQDATSGTVAAGNATVGTTVAGAEITAATAYGNAKAVGTTTAMVIVEGKVAAATPVIVRHTGVAATAAGEAVVECDYLVR